MMQGDAYNIPIEIQLEDAIASQNDFVEVEIYIGNLRKTMSQGQITYDNEQQVFLFPITQEESMRFSNSCQQVQVRVKLKNNEVIGTTIPGIDVIAAISRVIL